MKKDCIIFRETLRQKISRSLSACALFVAFVALFFPLVSCAVKTPYEVLQDSVVSEMNAYRYADHSVIDKFIEYMDIAELEQFDIDPGEFSRSFFSEFDYTR